MSWKPQLKVFYYPNNVLNFLKSIWRKTKKAFYLNWQGGFFAVPKIHSRYLDTGEKRWRYLAPGCRTAYIFFPSNTYFWNGLKSSLPPSRTHSGFILVIKDTAITKDCLMTSERWMRGFRPVRNTPIHSPLVTSAESPRGPFTPDLGHQLLTSPAFPGISVDALPIISNSHCLPPHFKFEFSPEGSPGPSVQRVEARPTCEALAAKAVWRSWLPTGFSIYYINFCQSQNEELPFKWLYLLTASVRDRYNQERKINSKLW